MLKWNSISDKQCRCQASTKYSENIIFIESSALHFLEFPLFVRWMDPYVEPEFHRILISHKKFIQMNFTLAGPLIENEVFMHNFKCRTTVDSVSSRRRLHSSCRHLLLTLRPNDSFVMWRAEWIFFFCFENEFERLTRAINNQQPLALI